MALFRQESVTGYNVQGLVKIPVLPVANVNEISFELYNCHQKQCTRYKRYHYTVFYPITSVALNV